MENTPQFSTLTRLVLTGILMLSLVVSLYMALPSIRARQENTRLKAQLLKQRQRTQALRGLLDTVQAPPLHPAPASTFGI